MPPKVKSYQAGVAPVERITGDDAISFCWRASKTCATAIPHGCSRRYARTDTSITAFRFGDWNLRTQPLHRNVQRFRDGIVFKAYKLLYHSTLGLGVIKKKKRSLRFGVHGFGFGFYGSRCRVQGLGFRV